ncbi:MAG: OmpA family protein [Magnetococcus sp. WYHC-3]
MKRQWHSLSVLALLAGLSMNPAHAEVFPWAYKGYQQHHPHVGHRVISEFGTQSIFPPADSDGDGVVDPYDRCPGTPKGVRVDEEGCELDADGDGVVRMQDWCPKTPKGDPVDRHGCSDHDRDGVADEKDTCPTTPPGVKVDADGCSLDGDKDGVHDGADQCPETPVSAQVDGVGCCTLLRAHFDFRKAEIKPEFIPMLTQLAAVLKKNPGVRFMLSGHTDDVGTPAFNEELSMERAEAVRLFLVGQGVSVDRLDIEGHSFNQPVARNNSNDGRAMNRRVDLTPQK